MTRTHTQSQPPELTAQVLLFQGVTESDVGDLFRPQRMGLNLCFPSPEVKDNFLHLNGVEDEVILHGPEHHLTQVQPDLHLRWAKRGRPGSRAG